MNLKGLALALFISSSTAQAQERAKFYDYLQLKIVKCELTQNKLNEQVTRYIEFFKKQIGEELQARGSDIENVTDEAFELDPAAPSTTHDFDIVAEITVTIQKLNFHIRTTHLKENSSTPKVEKGLWFPLTIANRDKDEPCRLSTITIPEEKRSLVPDVDLIIGEPPRVVASQLIRVLDVSAQLKPQVAPSPEPKPSPTPSPAPTATPTPQAPPVVQPKPEKKKVREYTERRERRQARKHHRRHRTERRAPRNVEPPAPVNECAGDISAWQYMVCGITGGKSD